MRRKRLLISALIGAGILLTGDSIAFPNEGAKLTVVYNNVSFDERLTTGWGFSCFVHHRDKGILFDTGGDGTTLLSNMEKLGIHPKQIERIVLSHIHGDHTGGLEGILRHNQNVTVYVPVSFPQTFKNEIRKAGSEIISVSQPMEIYSGVYTTGELGAGIKEQGLILKTNEGLVIITGCAHPGIVKMVKHVKDWLKEDIYLAMGGFHLMGYSAHEVAGVLEKLRKLGIKKVAPSHCTGDTAMKLFGKVWEKDFIDGGCGAVITLP
ncbi:MAG: MBL fold metallo-hydrolase [Deltaproteobacteria bacterium]|nr:MBL fold metallo-hydrolase [Deltaproteobacteria bacterium]